ncbi:hypothetical protein MX715_002074 [Vibrio parahaemolyticus]|nr:hypothetical protein [Vibrio parahaemolyticus]EJC6768561.1 hypothetical protein [Vibrio parahaemolyticus]EJC6978709.1 hypothetical protein [Vibrio parahaemolyticus]EJC7045956.1 hypothetical protein [Vibrio parahaemolyticus]EJC7085512.1 hypothetical protein [Vibrio parahaemolyticus]
MIEAERIIKDLTPHIKYLQNATLHFIPDCTVPNTNITVEELYDAKADVLVENFCKIVNANKELLEIVEESNSLKRKAIIAFKIKDKDIIKNNAYWKLSFIKMRSPTGICRFVFTLVHITQNKHGYPQRIYKIKKRSFYEDTSIFYPLIEVKTRGVL